MKILLDENIDVRSGNNFSKKYEVFMVKEMGWNGIKKGQLLLGLISPDINDMV